MDDDVVDPQFVEQIMSPMVDAFVEGEIEDILITCTPVKDSTTWCAAHDSLWMPDKPCCARRRDIEDLVERGIIAWETRHGR